MLKLARHLYGWTADPRYFDYYERALLNHRLGTIQPGNRSHPVITFPLTPRRLEDLSTPRISPSGAAPAPASRSTPKLTDGGEQALFNWARGDDGTGGRFGVFLMFSKTLF